MQSRAWRPRPLCLRRAENPRDRGRHRGDRLGCLDKRSSGRGGVKSQRLARRAVPTAAPAPYDFFGSRMPRSPLAGKTWRRPGGAVFSLWNLARSIPAYKNPPPFAVLEAAEITHRRASPARGNGQAIWKSGPGAVGAVLIESAGARRRACGDGSRGPAAIRSTPGPVALFLSMGAVLDLLRGPGGVGREGGARRGPAPQASHRVF